MSEPDPEQLLLKSVNDQADLQQQLNHWKLVGLVAKVFMGIGILVFAVGIMIAKSKNLDAIFDSSGPPAGRPPLFEWSGMLVAGCVVAGASSLLSLFAAFKRFGINRQIKKRK